jgi:hypothetical protein
MCLRVCGQHARQFFPKTSSEFATREGNFEKVDRLLGRFGRIETHVVSSPPHLFQELIVFYTPTMLGSLLAGVAMWLLFWYGVNHVDSIPYLNQYVTRKAILEWIKKNPAKAFLLSEGINVCLHGLGTASSVFFNFGGSLVNITAIWGVVPVHQFVTKQIAALKVKAAQLKQEIAAQKEAA